ncbi:MAG: hypothetical protein ABFD04_16975 [Syntrophomonas sp.]
MPWIHGSIELEDGSTYAGDFFIKEDRQLDKVFRPDFNEELSYLDDDELVVSEVNPQSAYQYPGK